MRTVARIGFLIFALLACDARSADESNPVAFQISLLERPPGYDPGRRAGEPIPIRCVFSNQSSRPVELRLKDHDSYHGTLPFPESMLVRITDGAKAVVTANEINKEGWWTVYYFSSQISTDEPGDVITIPPGKHVTRTVDLLQILMGCPRLREGLPPGDYEVQLCLDSLESNRTKITLIAK
jgi:hypothetical protein